MKQLITLFVCCFYSYSYGQIIAPDTVCVGTTVSFSTSDTATTYTWNFDSLSVVQPLLPLSLLYGTGGTPAFTSFNKEGSDHYVFVTDYVACQLKRLSYGPAFPGGTPTITNLGACGITAPKMEAIEIVKDPISGNWFGLLAASNQVSVLSFGASLSNIPTYTMYSIPTLSWAHQLSVVRYMGQWVAFVGDRGSTIKRLYFGSSLTNPPVSVTIPNVGSVSEPCNFTIYEQAGNWYMLVTSLFPGTLTRYNFGTNLLNTAPTGTLLPSPTGMINIPRSINLLNDCEGHLIGYILNEGGNIIKVDFSGSISTMPTFTNLGPLGVTSLNSVASCNYNDTFAFLTINYTGTSGIRMFRPLSLTPSSSVNYYSNTASHTFTTPGIFDVTLNLDMAYTTGPSVYCKPIVVLSGPLATTGTPTVAVGGTTTLSNAAASGAWSTSSAATATVSSTGVVTGVAVGTAYITYAMGSSCGDTTTLITVYAGPGDTITTSTGKTANATNVRWSVFPNPTSGVLKIESATTGTFALYAIDGRFVQQYEIKEVNTFLKLPANLAPGIYICRLNGDDGNTVTVRLVCER